MNRRDALKYGGLAAAAAAVGVGGYGLLSRKTGLAARLDPLFDPAFREIAESMDALELLDRLKQKGVVDEAGNIEPAAVRALAGEENIVEYNGRYYTETELELYSLAYLVEETDVSLPEPVESP